MTQSMLALPRTSNSASSTLEKTRDSAAGDAPAERRAGAFCLCLGALVLLTACGESLDSNSSERCGSSCGISPIASTSSRLESGASLCDGAHVELSFLRYDETLLEGDMVCHDRYGRHAVSYRNPDLTFAKSPGWWPSATTTWCDPAHLKTGDFNSDAIIDLSCHSDDGQHLFAFGRDDGTFSPTAWWPALPGQGMGWCDPAHLRMNYYNDDYHIDLSCHSEDGQHIIAFGNGDGTFSRGAWWPHFPGQGLGWCDPAHLRVGRFRNDSRAPLDLSCHSEDGQHIIAFGNGDGTFVPAAWWPSPPGQGPGWCDPAHVRIGYVKTAFQQYGLSCHTDDGRHIVASGNGDGTFSPAAWWPSPPGQGSGWCDPAHLKVGIFDEYLWHGYPVNLTCHSDDGKHIVAFGNPDGTFNPKTWWPSAPGGGASFCAGGQLRYRHPNDDGANMYCISPSGAVATSYSEIIDGVIDDGSFVATDFITPQWPD